MDEAIPLRDFTAKRASGAQSEPTFVISPSHPAITSDLSDSNSSFVSVHSLATLEQRTVDEIINSVRVISQLAWRIAYKMNASWIVGLTPRYQTTHPRMSFPLLPHLSIASLVPQLCPHNVQTPWDRF